MSLGCVGILKGQISTANLVIFFLFSKSSMKIPLLGWKVVDKYSSAEAIGRLKKEPMVGRQCDLPWVGETTYSSFFDDLPWVVLGVLEKSLVERAVLGAFPSPGMWV